ncbi:hypothetical protein EVB27_074 [Rhizobium phage RHph_TM16]|nr:hypothetical protein EVB27_074 [Rhizobium phage RHph_TM16]
MDNFAYEDGPLPGDPEWSPNPINPRGKPTLSLEVRLTHKYVGTYRHLDAWQDVGMAVIRCTETELMDDGEDPCEPTRTTMLLEIHCDEVTDSHVIMRAIQGALGSHGCAHDWDCCGCWSTRVGDIAHVKDNLWFVETHSSRNY